MAILCPDCGREYDITLFEFRHTVTCDCGAVLDPFASGPVEFPVDGVLDLHTFNPAEVKDLIPTYLEACRSRGITRVRIIHGKGSGSLLRTVHAVLKRLPGVASFELAGESEGGWGATIVRLLK
jgi:DNA-nicking Smr family endonuclease